MARRRLLTILATTVIAGGLSAAPAFAGPLDDLTGGLEDAVTSVTEEVQTTTTEVVETLTGGGGTTATLPPVEVGTGDGTLDVKLQVDVAPSDADGSPQLEVDGGVTIADQEVDLGAVTDPIEEAVDPDPAPSPSPSPSPDGSPSGGQSSDAVTRSPRPSGPGGLLEGGGVVAASTGAPSQFAPENSPFAHTVGDGFDGSQFGVKRYGGGTMALDRVPDPEVAPPMDTTVESPWTAAPSAEAEAETPAVLATDTGPGGSDQGPIPGLLRVIAAAMVLGTGAAWARAMRQA